MSETLTLQLPLNTSILLTVSGLSKCVEIEANAALSLLPSSFGLGIALSFNLPVTLKVCGISRVAIQEEVEISVSGPGLAYSDPRLPILLQRLGVEAYRTETLSLREVYSASGFEDLELVLASIEGSVATVWNTFKPLSDLAGYNATIVKLYKQIDDAAYHLAKVAPKLVYEAGSILEDTILLIENMSILERKILPPKMRRLCSRNLLCLLDYTGKYLIILKEANEVEELSLLNKLSKFGDVVSMEVIVPPI